MQKLFGRHTQKQHQTVRISTSVIKPINYIQELLTPHFTQKLTDKCTQKMETFD